MKKPTSIKKETRGGARKGAGAKPRFNVPTTRIYFTVPVDKQHQIKNEIKLMLNKYVL